MGDIHFDLGNKQNWSNFDVCTELPPKVNSEENIFERRKSPDPFIMTNSMPELEISMAIMFFLSQALHFLLKRLGFPKISSQIISGMILALLLVDLDGKPRLPKDLFTRTGQEALGTVSMFGYQLYLFITAVKMDVSSIFRLGRKPAIVGFAAPLIPFLCGMGIKSSLQRHIPYSPSDKKGLTSVVVGQSLTSFPVIYSLVVELNILNSEFGRLALSASMVSDIVSFFLTTFIGLGGVYSDVGLTKALTNFSAILVYILVVVFIIRPLMFRIIKSTPEGWPVKNVYVYTVILLALISGLVTNYFGGYLLLGPYIMGLAIPDGPPLGSAIVDKLDCFVSGVFLPLLITSTGMRVDFKMMKFDKMMKSNIVIVFPIYVIKLIACLIPCLYYNIPTSDSFALALIMTSQGIVEVALYAVLKDNDQLGDGIYDLVVLTVLAISIFVPYAVKSIYDSSRRYEGYQKRNIMHLKPNSDLRILACINRPDDIPAMINLLDNSCPTKDNSVNVYVLHLIELVGSASPIFISHQMQKKSLSNVSYSENVIVSFSRFEEDYSDSVTVNVYTAVSPPKLMHDDICTMALDKLTSLIILPFHRTWSMDGSVEVDDHMVRTLNTSVVEKAPCSVGILINRGRSRRRRQPNFAASPDQGYVRSVCMIFLGGKDDREALIYAKRMATDRSINVYVLHFSAPPDHAEDPNMKWDKMLDAEVLKDVRYSNNMSGFGAAAEGSSSHVGYMEEVVNNGSEMASIVKSLVDEYDLIITGRRFGVECPQTAGLTAWSEFPELGVIGDLLASTDIYGRASVLVIQQQVID